MIGESRTTPELSAAVQAMYVAFAKVPQPRSFPACPCCMEDREIAATLSKPARALTSCELAPYASHALLTVGSEADYRYFFPRILEILITEPGWWPDPEVVARAMVDAKWTAWPQPQQKAIHDVFDALMAELIRTANGWEMDSWFCAFGRAGWDISAYLSKLQASPAGLIAYYERNSPELVEGKLSNGFWDEARTIEARIIAWFQSTPVQAAIAAAYAARAQVLDLRAIDPAIDASSA